MHIQYWGYLKREKLAWACLGIILIFFLLAIFPFWMAPYPEGDYVTSPFLTYNLRHILGTNDLGQDILSEVIWGARYTLWIGFGCALLGTFIAILFSFLATTMGWAMEQVLMRFVDLMITIPSLLLIILFGVYIEVDAVRLILLLSFFLWAHSTRIFREKIKETLTKPYVRYAEGLGAKRPYLLIRHVLPELYPLIMLAVVRKFKMGVFLEAIASFLGVCAFEGKSWGGMLRNALEYPGFPNWWSWLLGPSVALSLLLISLGVLGAMMEEMVEPRLRRQQG
ncbi:MAG: ABC transporter permease [Deltaproteobacteria bacterium]|nr:ABC transporter permease [Deltaproteobacteria bacterium]